MRSDRVPSDAHFRGRDLLIPARLSCRLVTSQGDLPCSCERAGEACVCLTAFSWELLGCRESISDAIRRRPLPPLHQLDRHDCLRDATYATCHWRREPKRCRGGFSGALAAGDPLRFASESRFSRACSLHVASAISASSPSRRLNQSHVSWLPRAATRWVLRSDANDRGLRYCVHVHGKET